MKRRRAVSGLKYHQCDFLKVSFTQLYLTSCFLHQLIYQVHPALSEVVEDQFSPAPALGKSGVPPSGQRMSLLYTGVQEMGDQNRGVGNSILLSVPISSFAVAKKTNLSLAKYDFMRVYLVTLLRNEVRLLFNASLANDIDVV